MKFPSAIQPATSRTVVGIIVAVRMICAMFLSKNLLIDWRIGEQWFMQQLKLEML